MGSVFVWVDFLLLEETLPGGETYSPVGRLD
jgi:hypothetical protein